MADTKEIKVAAKAIDPRFLPPEEPATPEPVSTTVEPIVAPVVATPVAATPEPAKPAEEPAAPPAEPAEAIVTTFSLDEPETPTTQVPIPASVNELEITDEEWTELVGIHGESGLKGKTAIKRAIEKFREAEQKAPANELIEYLNDYFKAGGVDPRQMQEIIQVASDFDPFNARDEKGEYLMDDTGAIVNALMLKHKWNQERALNYVQTKMDDDEVSIQAEQYRASMGAQHAASRKNLAENLKKYAKENVQTVQTNQKEAQAFKQKWNEVKATATKAMGLDIKQGDLARIAQPLDEAWKQGPAEGALALFRLPDGKFDHELYTETLLKSKAIDAKTREKFAEIVSKNARIAARNSFSEERMQLSTTKSTEGAAGVSVTGIDAAPPTESTGPLRLTRKDIKTLERVT